jgi:hypothetical protein
MEEGGGYWRLNDREGLISLRIARVEFDPDDRGTEHHER